MEINNSVVIITGGSTGIGKATAVHLLKKGAKINIAARSEPNELPNIEDIAGADYHVTDITITDDIKRMVRLVYENHQRIDVLINNAAQGLYADVENIDSEDYRKIMEVNVFGPLTAMQEVIPYMKAQKKGMIVNVGSMATTTHIKGMSAYSSTKYALDSITRTARKELAPHGIVVSTIMPKNTDTDFVFHSRGNIPTWANKRPINIDSPDLVAQSIAKLIESEVEEIRL